MHLRMSGIHPVKSLLSFLSCNWCFIIVMTLWILCVYAVGNNCPILNLAFKAKNIKASKSALSSWNLFRTYCVCQKYAS